MNRILTLAFTANLFEWYEFSLTAFMALEIGRRFFPATSEEAALMLSFMVFASSYLARPLGSIFFGYLGDRQGTGPALKLSILGMAIPATLIAALPTYETAGYVATGLLLGLKIIQGLCAGGEFPLTGYFVSLNTSQGNRGVHCAIAVASGFFGMLLASGVIAILPYAVAALSRYNSLIPDRYIPAPWRWPFLSCIPLAMFIYKIRASICNAPVRGEKIDTGNRTAWPLIQAGALVAFMEIVIYSLFVWMPSYLHVYLRVSSADASATNSIALFTFAVSMIAAGYLSRYVDPSILVVIGMSLVSVTALPLFIVLQRTTLAALMTAQVMFAILASCIVGVIFVVLPDLFKDNWGSLGMVTTYSISTAIFGGTAPLVCAYLIDATRLPTAPALYILFAGMLATPVAYQLMRQRLRVLDPSDGRMLSAYR